MYFQAASTSLSASSLTHPTSSIANKVASPITVSNKTSILLGIEAFRNLVNYTAENSTAHKNSQGGIKYGLPETVPQIKTEIHPGRSTRYCDRKPAKNGKHEKYISY